MIINVEKGRNPVRVADFFCGGGGFSEGFRQAGYEIVFAVDKWKPAITTYKGNKPGVNVIKDDVIRISQLCDEEFEKLVPDSEVIIGSPPCQSFSHSNKSGNADKTLGIQLIEAYLRIVARKKFKQNSILRYWVLENVPSVQEHIKDKYSAYDLGLRGDFVLYTKGKTSGVYNAKYFGAPTNRKRYLCGDFPPLVQTKTDKTVVTLKAVLDFLGDPMDKNEGVIIDANYPDLRLRRDEVTDHHYIYKLAPFEVETARRLKQDKGYMGSMAFPENINKPSRTIMATMSTSSREAMILGYSKGYRLPTVRETASMMGFPIDYRFFGKTKATKHTLVGNAVPPPMSYAVAKAIALDAGVTIPKHYIPISYDNNVEFYDLNWKTFPTKKEKAKRDVAKFKYHIPYLIYDAYRVELTNYHSDFDNKKFKWDAEIHYSQGKARAKVFLPVFLEDTISPKYRKKVCNYIKNMCTCLGTYNEFQQAFCMTEDKRKSLNLFGPYELLAHVKNFITSILTEEEMRQNVDISCQPQQLPQAIVIGYYILNQLVVYMGGLQNGCSNQKSKINRN